MTPGVRSGTAEMRVAEFCAGSPGPLAKGIVHEAAVLREIVATKLDAGAVKFAAIAKSSPDRWARLFRGRSLNWPVMIPGVACQEIGAEGLMKLANPGFSLVLGIADDQASLSRGFAAGGLLQSGSSILGSGGKFDPLFISWNRESLARALEVAMLISSAVLITCGHDCAPIYLIAPNR